MSLPISIVHKRVETLSEEREAKAIRTGSQNSPHRREHETSGFECCLSALKQDVRSKRSCADSLKSLTAEVLTDSSEELEGEDLERICVSAASAIEACFPRDSKGEEFCNSTQCLDKLLEKLHEVQRKRFLCPSTLRDLDPLRPELKALVKKYADWTELELIQERTRFNESLELSHCGQAALCVSIGQFQNLICINLNFNLLKGLPESICDLIHLKQLKVGSNALEALPASIGRLTQLRVLSLHSNILFALPDSIGNLSNLTELNVSYNHLTVLPESIGGLNGLQKLRLNKNELTDLPDSIGQLVNLREFDLSCNLLTIIPHAIGKLSKMKKFDVYFNRLVDLPVFLATMPRHCDISAGSNLLKSECLSNFRALVASVRREHPKLGPTFKAEPCDMKLL